MKLLIAALLAVFSTGAMAEWTYLTSSEDNAYDIYIDKTTIRKRGNVAKMWELMDFKAPREAADGKSFLSLKALQEQIFYLKISHHSPIAPPPQIFQPLAILQCWQI